MDLQARRCSKIWSAEISIFDHALVSIRIHPHEQNQDNLICGRNQRPATSTMGTSRKTVSIILHGTT